MGVRMYTEAFNEKIRWGIAKRNRITSTGNHEKVGEGEHDPASEESLNSEHRHEDEDKMAKRGIWT